MVQFGESTARRVDSVTRRVVPARTSQGPDSNSDNGVITSEHP